MANNIDEILTTQNLPVKDDVPEVQEVQKQSEEKEEKLNYIEKFRKDKDEVLSEQKQSLEPVEKTIEDKPIENKVEETESDDDEYGIGQTQPRTYTEEEVNKIIRDRLARGKLNAEPQPIQNTPSQAPKEQVDAQTEESWENQLESFVEKTVTKLSQKQREEQWRAQEQKVQAEFESRFTVGMGRYNDFTEIVRGKPITDAMMVASRGMKDPAAFFYAASKLQPKELERISQIPDHSVQALEIGRLEERMKKAKTLSKSPKPISNVTSDYSEKSRDKISIDHLINADAKRKLGRR